MKKKKDTAQNDPHDMLVLQHDMIGPSQDKIGISRQKKDHNASCKSGRKPVSYQKKKIAYLTPEFLPPLGGVGIYSVALVKELSKHYEIHVLTTRRGDQTDKEVERHFKGMIKVHFLADAADTFFYNLKFQLAVLFKFPSLHKRYGFDLVHSANLVQMPDIFLLLKGLHIAHIVTIHTTIRGQAEGILNSKKTLLNMSPSERYSLLFYPIISFLERLYMWKAKNIITITRSYQKIIEGQYKLKRPHVIGNGIDMELFKDDAKTIERSEPIVLFVSRLNAQKGMFVMAQAIREVLKENQDVHFVFCGQGKDILEKSLSGIPKDKVTYLGVVENKMLSGIYRSAEIFVLPSFSENMPLSIMEAMRSRCAVIATRVGGVPEIIEDGKDGILIRPGDSRSLARAMLDLLRDKEKLEKIKRNACKKAIREFSSVSMALRTKKVYEEIIERWKRY